MTSECNYQDGRNCIHEHAQIPQESILDKKNPAINSMKIGKCKHFTNLKKRKMKVGKQLKTSAKLLPDSHKQHDDHGAAE